MLEMSPDVGANTVTITSQWNVKDTADIEENAVTITTQWNVRDICRCWGKHCLDYITVEC